MKLILYVAKMLPQSIGKGVLMKKSENNVKEMSGFSIYLTDLLLPLAS